MSSGETVKHRRVFSLIGRRTSTEGGMLGRPSECMQNQTAM